MTSYGTNSNSRAKSLKSFFLKSFIFIFIVIGTSLYFFMSDFGNSFQLLKDIKQHTNKNVATVYAKESLNVNNAIRRNLGLDPVVGAPAANSVPEKKIVSTSVLVVVPKAAVEKTSVSVVVNGDKQKEIEKTE